MIVKIFCRTALVVLTLLLLFFLISCSADESPVSAEINTAVTESGGSESSPAENVLVLFENGKCNYSIIRSDIAERPTISVTTSIHKFLRDQMKVDALLTTDWVKRGESAPEDTPEILVGDTNRPESAAVAAELTPGTYRIKVVGNRVVICATLEWMLSDAVNEFIGLIDVDSNGVGTIPDDLDIVGDLSGYFRDNWDMPGLPAYEGGKLSTDYYSEKIGYNRYDTDCRVVCSYGTSAAEFADYIKKTESYGFNADSVSGVNGITAYRLTKNTVSAYAYYAEKVRYARFVLDQCDTAPLEEFCYSYDKQPGDNTTVYQYGLVMDPNGIDFSKNGGTRLNCGHMYIIKLADNSLVIVDGGDNAEMSNQAADGLLDFCREVTGVPEGEKMRISCWFISHCHPDHYVGFARFLTLYHDRFELERMMYNFTEATTKFTKTLNYVQEFYPDVIYHKPHTGESIQLADIKMDVMYTLEDQIMPVTGKYASTDFNDSCTVLRVLFDDHVFLLTGDINKEAEKVLVSYYDRAEFKTDILQVSHHGWNNLKTLYNFMKPMYSLYPQSSGGALRGPSGNGQAVLPVVRSISKHIYFGGDQTVGIEVVDGQLEVVYEADVIGISYTDWDW